MERHRKRNHFHHQRVKRGEQPTTVKIVYITAKPTFTGKPAGYSTIEHDEHPPPRVKTASKPTSAPQETSAKEADDPKSARPTPTVKPTVGVPKFSTTSPAETTGVDGLTTSTFHSTFRTSYISNTIDSAKATTIPSSLPSSSDNSSGGAVGVVVGGSMAGVLILLAIAAFFYRKHKQKAMNKAYGKPEDEKFGIITGGAISEKKQSQPPAAIENSSASSPRSGALTLANSTTAPVVAPVAGPQVRPVAQDIPRKPVPAPLVLAPAPIIAQAASKRDSSKSISTTPLIPAAQPSPTLSAFSDSQSVIVGTPNSSIVAAGGDPTPVHRVIMDFIPSMPDELELRAGGLVRVLHEYDDGWALCIRLDRSQQGVCPRTCLSVNRVKPRPRPGTAGSTSGSPGGPNTQRRGSPHSTAPAGRPPYAQNPGRPGSPGPHNFPQPQTPVYEQRQPRPQSPASFSRPQTPTQRPQTPKGQPLPQITISPSPEPAAPRSPPRSPPTANIPVNPTPQPKESSPLAQQSTTAPIVAAPDANATPAGTSSPKAPAANGSEFHAM